MCFIQSRSADTPREQLEAKEAQTSDSRKEHLLGVTESTLSYCLHSDAIVSLTLAQREVLTL